MTVLTLRNLLPVVVRLLAVVGVGVAIVVIVAAVKSKAAGRDEPVEPEKSSWTKQCGATGDDGKETCMTSHVLFDERGKLFASLAVETVSDRKDPRLLIAVPVGLFIEPGLVLQVDDALAKKLDYRICLTDRCFADFSTDAALLGRLRRGAILKVAFVGASREPFTLKFPLAGFSDVLDGPSVAAE